MRSVKRELRKARSEVKEALRELAIKRINARKPPGVPPWPIDDEMIEREIKNMSISEMVKTI